MVEPRLLTREQAAEYCALRTGSFKAWVQAGRLPKPLPGTHRWDRKAIDMALDKLSGIETNMEVGASQNGETVYEKWKREQAAKRAATAG